MTFQKGIFIGYDSTLCEVAAKIDAAKVQCGTLMLTSNELRMLSVCNKLQFKLGEPPFCNIWTTIYCECETCQKTIDFNELELKLRALMMGDTRICITPIEWKVINNCMILNYIYTYNPYCILNEEWFKICSLTCICNTTRKY